MRETVVANDCLVRWHYVTCCVANEIRCCLEFLSFALIFLDSIMQVQVQQYFFCLCVASTFAYAKISGADVNFVPNSRCSLNCGHCVLDSVSEIVMSVNLNVVHSRLLLDGINFRWDTVRSVSYTHLTLP